MRQISASKWECTQCGAEVWVERGRRPIAALLTTSSGPRERIVTVDGRIVHRCTRPPDR
jgi:hypothetical protein